MRGRSIAGEIVEVEGGHIMRSTDRKDRHSKVCTAKGPRDRRVRLSAHTAIQFYDVQDRLGFDRPSKAVDWLMKNAKAAIDHLAELPPWMPMNSTAQEQQHEQKNEVSHNELKVDNIQQHIGENSSNNSLSFLQQPLDSDPIADTVKSFFPRSASAETSSSMQFQSYTQDLRLSLQSVHDQMLFQHHQQKPQVPQNEQMLIEFDGFQSPVDWNSGQQIYGGQSQFLYSQRGTLQSSNMPSVRSWIDQSANSSHQQVLTSMHHQAMMSGIFSGFDSPAQIEGKEEHDGRPNKVSSASSDSCH